MFTAVNIRNADFKDHRYIYCGRGNKYLPHSPLANPFILKNESDRALVCEKYREYFDIKIKEDGPLLQELRRVWLVHKELKDVFLVCYCKPKQCHCDTIASFLNSFL